MSERTLADAELELRSARKSLRKAEAELASIDEVLARRPALDKPTRWQNIEHAINTAKRADDAERERDEARGEGLECPECGYGSNRIEETICPNDGTTRLVVVTWKDRAMSAAAKIPMMAAERDEARREAKDLFVEVGRLKAEVACLKAEADERENRGWLPPQPVLADYNDSWRFQEAMGAWERVCLAIIEKATT